MIYDFSKLRPKPSYPTYPSYHRGAYLEDYFFEYFVRNMDKFIDKGVTLIPISWTTLYVENSFEPIQDYINVLDPKKAYIAVSQHDEGIRQRLPTNTRHFAAGGLGGGIPIPLICSPLPFSEPPSNITKSYLCSFVGSMTHPIRAKLYDTYVNTKGFHFDPPQQWSQVVQGGQLNRFCNLTHMSTFALAPRGYGLSSFRLYEIMQLGAIPVYVSDRHWLPFTHKLNWNEFCVVIHESEIPDLHDILQSIPEEKRIAMAEKGKQVWKDHFTLESCCNTILEMI